MFGLDAAPFNVDARPDNGVTLRFVLSRNIIESGHFLGLVEIDGSMWLP
jgi:hypothetical protein